MTEHMFPDKEPSRHCYRYGCRCAACGECNSAYTREYRKRNAPPKTDQPPKVRVPTQAPERPLQIVSTGRFFDLSYLEDAPMTREEYRRIHGV